MILHVGQVVISVIALSYKNAYTHKICEIWVHDEFIKPIALQPRQLNGAKVTRIEFNMYICDM